MLEIERKFIPVNLSMSNLEKMKSEYDWVEITQIYIQPAPEEIRVRKYKFPDGSVKFEKTKKIGVGLSREEINSELSFENFSNIERSYILKVEKTRVFKDRFEIDFYTDGFVIVEIEFNTEEEAFEFNPDEFELLGKEITGLKEFSNYAIASRLAV